MPHPWPGNVRELRNYVQRAYILADRTLGRFADGRAASTVTAARRVTVVSIPVGTSLADADKQLILATLEQCGGVKTRPRNCSASA